MCLDFLTIDWELKGLGHNSNMILVSPIRKIFDLGGIQVLRHHVFDFLGPPTQLFDDLQYCKSSRIAIFWPHPPTSLMT